MVNNFLMRYPDSFGQRIKKLRTDLIYIIFKAQVNLASSLGDIGILRFYHIWAYHKKYSLEVYKNTVMTALPLYKTYFLWKFQSSTLYSFRGDAGQSIAKNKNNKNFSKLKRTPHFNGES